MDKLLNSSIIHGILNKDSNVSHRISNKKNHCRFMSLKQYKSELERNHLPQLRNKRPKYNDCETKSNFLQTILLSQSNNLNCSISPNSTFTVPDLKLKNFETKLKPSANNTINLENNDVDRGALISFYHTNGNGNKRKMTETSFSMTKNELFQKYQIKKKLNKSEKDGIKSIIESDTFHKSKTRYQSITIKEEFFKSPLSSLKKVKINKNIRDKVINISCHKQAKSYLDEFYKVKEGSN